MPRTQQRCVSGRNNPAGGQGLIRSLTFVLVLAIGLMIAAPGQASDRTKAQKKFAGSDVVQSYACLTCHAVGGSGGTVGPKLDQAGNRRSADWLRRWLKNPPAVRPGTLMPNFMLSNENIETLVGLLGNLKVELNTAAIMSRGGDDLAKGEQLFTRYDCLACHRIGQEGRFIGPDLTWLGNRRTPAWESHWLSGPDAVKPGTFMPDFKLPPDQIKALVTYLMSLKGQANAQSQEWELNTAFQLSSRPREVGERIYSRLGCNGCHGVGAKNDKTGRDGYTNPNAVPDGMMPAVNLAAQKFTAVKFADLLQTSRLPAKLDPAGAEPLPCPGWQGALDDDEMAALYAYFESLLPKK